MYSSMANRNLGQDVANKKERKSTIADKVAKSYSQLQAVGMRRYGSLIIINPSGFSQVGFFSASCSHLQIK